MSYDYPRGLLELEDRFIPRRFRSTRLRSVPTQSTSIDSPATSEEQALVDKEVSEIEAEILRGLHRKCALLRRRNGLSLINRLPDECLAMIFIWAQEMEECDASTSPQPSIVPERPEAPIVLSQVCSQWREVALSYPRLWSNLSVVAGDHNRSEDEQKFYLAGLEDRLKKMKEVPFELHIRGVSRRMSYHRLRERSTGLALRTDMDILAAYVSRCRLLDVQLPQNGITAGRIGSRFFTRMPVLESLSLTNKYDLREQIIVPMPIPGPHLTTLSLRGVQVHHVTKAALAGLDELRIRRSSMLLHDDSTELDDQEIERLRAAWPDDVGRDYEPRPMPLEVIQAATNVRVLELRAVYLSAKQNPNTVEFPRVEELELALGSSQHLDDDEDDEDEGNYVSSMVIFFQHINMPALRICKLSGSHAPYPMQMDDLLDALAAIAPPLTEFTLELVSFTNAQKLLNLLSFLPHLHTLSLIRVSLDKEAIEGLRADRPVVLLPNLRILRICRCRPRRSQEALPQPFSFITVRNMLRSRFESKDVTSVEELSLTDDLLNGTRDSQKQLEKWVRKVELDINRCGNRRTYGNGSLLPDAYNYVEPSGVLDDLVDLTDPEYDMGPAYEPSFWDYSPSLEEEPYYLGSPSGHSPASAPEASTSYVGPDFYHHLDEELLYNDENEEGLSAFEQGYYHYHDEDGEDDEVEY